MDYFRTIFDSTEYINNVAFAYNQKDIAKEYSISSYHFNRIFKIYVGISVVKYINLIRIVKAMELIDNTDKKMVDIAFEVGYNSHEIFLRSFKKIAGITPRAFKKAKQSIDVFVPRCVDVDAVNIKGGTIFSPKIMEADAIDLYGYKIDIDGDEKQNRDILLSLTKQVEHETESDIDNKNYALVRCKGQNESYSIFIGNENLDKEKCDFVRLPTTNFAEFAFFGDAFDVSHVFSNNFYSWVIAKKINLIEYPYNMIMFKDEKNQTIIRIPIES